MRDKKVTRDLFIAWLPVAIKNGATLKNIKEIASENDFEDFKSVRTFNELKSVAGI